MADLKIHPTHSLALRTVLPDLSFIPPVSGPHLSLRKPAPCHPAHSGLPPPAPCAQPATQLLTRAIEVLSAEAAPGAIDKSALLPGTAGFVTLVLRSQRV